MKISVYITSYNQKKYLIEAIESVLAQTLQPSQIIIADDCSFDGSQRLIKGYASRYPDLITPIYHEKNLGVTQTRIDALHMVTGDYVSYVDGDDRFLPTKLEKEARLLRDNCNIQVVFSNNYYITESGERSDVWANSESPPDGDVFCQTFARDFPRKNLFRMELINYHAWKVMGFHDPNLKLYEDYDMRIRLSKKFRIAYYPEPLSEIRTHDKGLSNMPMSIHLEALEYIYKKNKILLADLDVSNREYIQSKLKPWLAKIATRTATQIINQGSKSLYAKSKALGYFLKACSYHPKQFDIKLLKNILLS